MAAVNFTTKISFYSGVPLDEQNTISANKAMTNDGAYEWFTPFKVLETSGTLSYQRNNSVARISVLPGDSTGEQLDYETLYTCNWMIYYNPNFEKRNIFCQITQIEYINAGRADIHFKIDGWLTYIDTIKDFRGLIERQHYGNELNMRSVSAMRIENVAYDEYQIYSKLVVPIDELQYIVAYYATPDGQMFDETIIPYGQSWPIIPNYETPTGVPSLWATHFFSFDNLQQFLSTYRNSPQSIKSITIVPFSSQAMITQSADYVLNQQVKNPWTKCLKYPNAVLRATNGQGETKYYYREWFHEGDYNSANDIADSRWVIQQNFTGETPLLALIPYNYKGQEYNYDEALYWGNFPTVQWVGDSFGHWLMTNGSTFAFESIGKALISYSTMGAAGAALTGISAITDVIRQAKEPDTLHGSSINGGLTNILTNRMFTIDTLVTHPGLMAANNKYWNMYGYLCGHAGNPNLFTHPQHNYIKGDFQFKFGGPLEFKQEITARLINGLRVWHCAADEFGDYEIDNRA